MTDASFTRPVERKPAHTVPLAPPVTPKVESKWIALAQIEPSPFNPRKDFPKEDLAELAASIQARGLLENLVVRPHPKKKDHFELMGGERRFRALKLNKTEGAQCNVIAADDGEALATQIVENMEREDLTPLEEAEAFVALQKQDPKRWSAAAIGRAVGKTDSFVIQRMRLLGLNPAARKMLAEGELSVEKARILAAAPAAVQKEIVEESWDFDEWSVDTLRDHILEQLVPEGAAAFDVAKYKGGWHEEGKKRYFTDVEQFNKLQLEAANALLAKLRGIWPTAQLIQANNVYDWRWADSGDYLDSQARKRSKATGKFKVAKEKCTAVVWIDRTAKVCSAEGVAKGSAFPSSGGGGGAGYSGGPKPEAAHKRRYRLAYNEAVRAAVAANTDIGLRVLLTRFVDGTTRATYDHSALKKAHESILPKELLPLVNKWDERTNAKIWQSVSKLKAPQVVEMLSKYTSLSLDWSFSAYGRGKSGPPDLTVTVAKAAKAKLPKAADFKPATKAKPATKKAAAKAKAKPKKKA